MPVDQGTVVTLANVVILVNLEDLQLQIRRLRFADINDRAQGLTMPIRFINLDIWAPARELHIACPVAPMLLDLPQGRTGVNGTAVILQ